jgi:hypothetical protein
MRTPAPAPAFTFTRLDAGLVLVSVALGVLLACQEPSEVESFLRLTPTERPTGALPTPASAPALPSRSQLASMYPWVTRAFELVLPVTNALPCVLCVTSLGLGAATFRHRAARGRRAFRGPGILATALSVILVEAVLASEYVVRHSAFLARGYGTKFYFHSIWGSIADQAAMAVLAAWVVLALGRAWRPLPCAADRLGRALGGAWLSVLAWTKVVSWLVGLPAF